MIPALTLALWLVSPPLGVADVVLHDLTGNSDRVSLRRGEPVVVMVVTARRLRNLKSWERQLRARFDGLDFVRIVDVPEDPPLTHEAVATKLVRRVPEEIPVLIDLDRRWAAELELDTSRPNLLLLDREGEIAAREFGLADPERVEAFAAKIRELREAH